MRLQLTAEQAAAIAPHMRPGFALLGRVTREPFTGSNAATSGSLIIELGCVPEAALPALRQAIRGAQRPAPAARQGKRQAAALVRKVNN